MVCLALYWALPCLESPELRVLGSASSVLASIGEITAHIVPFMQIEYGVYGDNIMILVHSIIVYLLKGDYRHKGKGRRVFLRCPSCRLEIYQVPYFPNSTKILD